jgi:hypothetical protein
LRNFIFPPKDFSKFAFLFYLTNVFRHFVFAVLLGQSKACGHGISTHKGVVEEGETLLFISPFLEGGTSPFTPSLDATGLSLCLDPGGCNRPVLLITGWRFLSPAASVSFANSSLHVCVIGTAEKRNIHYI